MSRNGRPARRGSGDPGASWLERRRPSQRLLILAAAGLLAGAAVVASALVAVGPIGGDASALAGRQLPASEALQATASAAASGQSLFLEAATTADPTAKGQLISRSQSAGQVQDAAWSTYLHDAGASAGERRLQDEYTAAAQRSRQLGATVLGIGPSDPQYAAALLQEQQASAQILSTLDRLQHDDYAAALRGAAASVESRANRVVPVVLVAFGVATLVFVGVGALVLGAARRDEQRLVAEEQARATLARRSDLETQLQRGLEMEPTEDDTYGVIRQAVATVAAPAPVELLLADSSRAHFRQVLTTDGDGTGCPVGSPTQCPAASSGQTHRFADSTRLDTCPFLRERPAPVWATCVPVSIAGRTTGVLHAEHPLPGVWPEGLIPELELVARKAGDRIGVLRVLARTEAQAQYDSLTGLPNRRTLENRSHELLREDAAFVVAFADLDHFKDLNDTYGHDTGDRALRLFARVLRDSVRPNDIPGRYGGEEFVVVLPDTTLVQARAVADRVRANLAAAVETASVPPFTVSFGLALGDPGEAFSEAVARADAALLRAKGAGRNRVVADGEPVTDVPPPTITGDGTMPTTR